MEFLDKNLVLYLQSRFGKRISTFDDITQEEFAKIQVIPLIGKIQNENTEHIRPRVDFNILKLFPNLTRINIKGAYIDKADVKIINKYKGNANISFRSCGFDTGALDKLETVEELRIDSCFNTDYKFLKGQTKLKSLLIHNPYTETPVDIEDIPEENANTLKSLILDKCNINNFNKISRFKELELLSILNVKLPEEYAETINYLSNLTELYIDEQYNTQFENSKLIVRNDLRNLMFLKLKERNNKKEGE